MECFEKPTDSKCRAFEVEGKKLWVCPYQLAGQSEVFKKMFFGEFGDTDKEVISLPGKTLEEFVPFLTLLTTNRFYGVKVPEETMEDSFLSVWRLAHEYGVVGLEKYSEDYITTNEKCPLSQSNVCDGIGHELKAVRFGLKVWELAVLLTCG